MTTDVVVNIQKILAVFDRVDMPRHRHGDMSALELVRLMHAFHVNGSRDDAQTSALIEVVLHPSSDLTENAFQRTVLKVLARKQGQLGHRACTRLGDYGMQLLGQGHVERATRYLTMSPCQEHGWALANLQKNTRDFFKVMLERCPDLFDEALGTVADATVEAVQLKIIDLLTS